MHSALQLHASSKLSVINHCLLVIFYFSKNGRYFQLFRNVGSVSELFYYIIFNKKITVKVHCITSLSTDFVLSS